jgi:hypothetical protein
MTSAPSRLSDAPVTSQGDEQKCEYRSDEDSGDQVRSYRGD